VAQPKIKTGDGLGVEAPKASMETENIERQTHQQSEIVIICAFGANLLRYRASITVVTTLLYSWIRRHWMEYRVQQRKQRKCQN